MSTRRLAGSTKGLDTIKSSRRLIARVRLAARWQECSAGDDLAEALRRAFDTAAAARAPVVLNVPIESMTGDAWSSNPPPERATASLEPTLPPDAALAQAVEPAAIGSEPRHPRRAGRRLVRVRSRAS